MPSWSALGVSNRLMQRALVTLGFLLGTLLGCWAALDWVAYQVFLMSLVWR